MRIALLKNYERQGFTPEIADAYLPANYDAAFGSAHALIYGDDDHGWTLDGYVLPRLASGLYFAREVTEGNTDDE